MIELEQKQMLIYQHVTQLTLIDYSVREAFKIAHRVAALAFDDDFTTDGLAAAREAYDLASAEKAAPTADTQAPVKPKGKPKGGDLANQA